MPSASIQPTAASENGRTKNSKGLFPRLPLSRTLELPKIIFQLGAGEPVRRLSAFNALGKSPDSGTARRLIAASNSGYGLTTGSAASEYLELSQRGRSIVEASGEDSRLAAVYEVLFSNDIFSAFIARYNQKGMPLDEIAEDYLKRTYQLSDSDAKTFLGVIKANITEFGLLSEFSGKSVIISKEMALENLSPVPTVDAAAVRENSSASFVGVAAGRQVDNPAQGRKEAPRLAPRTLDPQIHFNIQIHLPQEASAEAYDAIFKSIASHLLGRGEE